MSSLVDHLSFDFREDFSLQALARSVPIPPNQRLFVVTKIPVHSFAHVIMEEKWMVNDNVHDVLFWSIAFFKLSSSGLFFVPTTNVHNGVVSVA